MMEQNKVRLSVQGDFTEPHLCQLFKQLISAGFAIGHGKNVNSSQFPYIAVDSTGDAQRILKRDDVLFLGWKRHGQTLPVVSQVAGKRNYWLVLIAIPALCCEISWCRDIYLLESPKSHVTIPVKSCTRSQNIILFLEKEQEEASELSILVHRISLGNGFVETQIKYHEEVVSPIETKVSSEYSLN